MVAILLVRKLEHREVKKLTQGHTAAEMAELVDPGSLVPELNQRRKRKREIRGEKE